MAQVGVMGNYGRWVQLTGTTPSSDSLAGLSLDDVRVVRGRGAFVLGPVGLDLPRRGVVGLLGRNGAGKSTLMGAIAQLHSTSSGVVSIAGRRLRSSGDRAWARRQVGLVPQSATLPALPNCEAFLHYAAYLRGVARSERQQSVDAALAAVNLADRRHVRLRSLSGGMARRILIAQALVNRPSVLLLDEPTAGLDPQQRGSLKRVLTGLAQETLVLMATHLVEDIASLAGRVIVLEAGAVIFDGSTTDFASLGDPAAADAQSRLESSFARLLDSAEGDHAL